MFLQDLQEHTYASFSLSVKKGYRPVKLLKTETFWHRHFSINFAKLFRETSLRNTWECPLLVLGSSSNTNVTNIYIVKERQPITGFSQNSCYKKVYKIYRQKWWSPYFRKVGSCKSANLLKRSSIAAVFYEFCQIVRSSFVKNSSS